MRYVRVLAVAIAVAALAAVATSAVAEESKASGGSAPAGAAPGAPKLPPEGKKWVQGFVGRFAAKDVVFDVGGQRMKGKMTLDCAPGAGGWAATCNAVMDFGKQKNRMVLVYGWDVAAGKAHMLEVNSMGEVHDHAGGWTDDRTITVVNRGQTPDGKASEDALTFAWKSPKQVVVTGQGTTGGANAWTFSGTFSKT